MNNVANVLDIYTEELNNDELKKIFINDDIRIARILNRDQSPTKYFITSRSLVFSISKSKIKVISQVGSKKDGYKRVNLKINDTVKMYLVHRLVATAFIPNPENKLQVNHKDGVRTNNNIENLEWCSAKENMRHSFQTPGLRPKTKNSINEDTARKICEMLETNLYTLPEIAKKCNTTLYIVKGIKYRTTWTDISKDFNVENHTIRADHHVKMSEDTCEQICQELEKNQLTIREISELFNVTYEQVVEIRAHKTWRHVSKKYKIDNHTIHQWQKQNIDKVDTICQLLQSSELSISDIARECKVNRSVVESILYRISFKQISKNYNFDHRYIKRKPSNIK